MINRFSALLAGLVLAILPCAVSAQTVYGSVTVCYFSTECAFANIPGLVHPANEAQLMRDAGEHQGSRSPASTGTATPVDAPAFQFTNTGTLAITDATFAITGDKSLGVVHDVFRIGTIKPGASFVIVPGASNDKKTHPAGGFFTYAAPGSPLDTSDSGPDDNALKFIFAGKIAGKPVTSRVIEPGKSLVMSVDGTVASINFLGGPGNADGPCNDCYAPKVVANIMSAPTKADGDQ